MAASRLWLAFASLVLVMLFATACASRPRDDGYAYLARYKADWQRSDPGQPMPVPLPLEMSSSPDGLSRTNGNANVNANGAKPILVFLDPGHGGVDTGTIGTTSDGTTVEEKNIALAIALRTADHLRADGIGVVLSRTSDSLPDSQPSDYAPDGKMLTPGGVLADLQRRIDRANASGAKVLLSIHLNAYTDHTVSGTQTFYDSSRPFGDQNLKFATLIQNTLIADLRAKGYNTPDRGITDDMDLQAESLGSLAGNYNHLVMLGPEVPGQLRPSQMPGALNESLFLSNPAEATAANTPAMQDLIATAYTKAIEQFLGWTPASSRQKAVEQTEHADGSNEPSTARAIAEAGIH